MRALLAAWWIIDALDTGAGDRRSPMDALLTVDEGPPWLPSRMNFATQSTEHPLALEGAPLVRHVDGTWEPIDFLDLDPLAR